jgi:N-methylhydantoinase A
MLLGVDVGGSFTDAVLLDRSGGLHTAKVPSTPAEESLGVMRAVRLVLERARATPGQVERFAHGMTVATNALLEGRTARTALIATAGFTDVIELARQARPHLYRLCEAGPVPLVPAELRFAAEERIVPEGILRPLEEGSARELCRRVGESSPAAVAVCLLHSYADPSHERLLGELLCELLPAAGLSLSSELVGTFREYERTATTALDAALSPPLASYLGRLRGLSAEAGLPEPQIMQSSGGLTSPARAGSHAALTVLSGPAGGVAGARLAAELAGEADVACFDMGGTSCDVCLIEGGEVPETAERLIAGRPVALPALEIQTVGAGGGSLAWCDSGGALRVGPASAGADPGPACYGRGGTGATVTDANLLLGRLPDDTPLAGAIVLDRAAAERAVGALAEEVGLAPLACAAGIVEVAEAEMLGALRLLTVERGIDPRSFALMPFGGAGGLHAAAMAEALGISRVLCPRAAGVLSAVGLAAAAPRRDVARTVMSVLAETAEGALEAARLELIEQVLGELGERPARIRVRHELRYRGQSFELPVDVELPVNGELAVDVELSGAALGHGELRAAFGDAHAARYGYRDERAPLELVNLRVTAWGRAPALRRESSAVADGGHVEREVRFGGEPHRTRLHRGELPAGARIEGPALLAMASSTLLVPPGWSGSVDSSGTIRLTHGERG